MSLDWQSLASPEEIGPKLLFQAENEIDWKKLREENPEEFSKQFHAILPIPLKFEGIRPAKVFRACISKASPTLKLRQLYCPSVRRKNNESGDMIKIDELYELNPEKYIQHCYEKVFPKTEVTTKLLEDHKNNLTALLSLTFVKKNGETHNERFDEFFSPEVMEKLSQKTKPEVERLKEEISFLKDEIKIKYKNQPFEHLLENYGFFKVSTKKTVSSPSKQEKEEKREEELQHTSEENQNSNQHSEEEKDENKKKQKSKKNIRNSDDETTPDKRSNSPKPTKKVKKKTTKTEKKKNSTSTTTKKKKSPQIDSDTESIRKNGNLFISVKDLNDKTEEFKDKLFNVFLESFGVDKENSNLVLNTFFKVVDEIQKNTNN